MKETYIKDLLIIALIVLCFWIGCNWERRPTPPQPIKYIKGKDSLVVDTLILIKQIIKPQPYKVVVAETIRVCDSIRYYTEAIKDSQGEAIVNTAVQGWMLKQDIQLRAISRSTFRVDTIVRTEHEGFRRLAPVVYVNKYGAGIGAAYEVKGMQVVGTYGIDKSIGLGLVWRLKK